MTGGFFIYSAEDKGGTVPFVFKAERERIPWRKIA